MPNNWTDIVQHHRNLSKRNGAGGDDQSFLVQGEVFRQKCSGFIETFDQIEEQAISSYIKCRLCVTALPRDQQTGEFRCNFCNCPYSTQSHLKRHLTLGCFMDPAFRIEERHTMNKIESRNHVCPRCSQGYKNKRTLDTHLRTACGREPKFQCPYCGLRSKHAPNIYTHIRRRHKGEDLFVIVDQKER